VRHGDELTALGYPYGGNRQVLDQFSAVYEGQTLFIEAQGRAGAEAKFKAGQVEPGYSGGPLLNLRTCRVMGVVALTRDSRNDLGGWAIEVPVVIGLLQECGQEQQSLNSGWTSAEAKQRESSHSGTIQLTPKHTDEYLRNKFSVPLFRNPFFTGREKVLLQIHNILSQQGAAALNQGLAISGLGGVGKTQIAVEYAYRYFYDDPFYQWIFWINSDTKEILHDDYLKLFVFLKLELPPPDPSGPNLEIDISEKKIQGVRDWLENNEEWLVIYDNADDPKILDKYRPKNPNGRVLVTSRSQEFDVIEIGCLLDVETMSHDDAVKFLFRRTKRNLNSFSEETENPEIVAARDLTIELGCLPLALEQAGAYISKMKVSFGQYMTKYRQQHLAWLEKVKPATGNYRGTVATTWLINFLAVEDKSEVAADLLRFSAFLPPDEIPLALIVDAADELGNLLSVTLADADDTLVEVYEVLEPLVSFSLVRLNTDSQTYSIHRLVQEVLKHEMEEGVRSFWSERTIHAVSKLLPYPGDSNAISMYSYLYSYAKISDLVLECKFEFITAAMFLFKTSVYSYFISSITDFSINISEGYTRCQLALSILEKRLSLGVIKSDSQTKRIHCSIYRDVLTAFSYDSFRFITSFELGQIQQFITECRSRLAYGYLIYMKSEEIAKEALLNAINENQWWIEPGGWLTTRNRLHECFQNCVFVQRYIAISLINWDASLLENKFLNGRREYGIALGIPPTGYPMLFMNIKSKTIMMEDINNGSIEVEVASYFDRAIAALV
jgi:hypothetical protein